jgi:hypothetical protein
MPTAPRRFILQALDPDHGSPVFEALFVVERLEELRTLLGAAADKDPDLRMFYTLEPVEITAIGRQFDVAFEPEGRKTCLYQWTGLREPPYLVHTGYELPLLLEGRKQFARMGMEHYPPLRHEGEDHFDHYVAQGVLHKEVDLEKFYEPLRLNDGRVFEGYRTVYYTRKGEEWRIPAWKLVLKASGKSGWNEDFERMEGMLFGYEDWQNDWWIEHLFKRRLKFGSFLVYLAVSASDLAEIETAGYRALPRSQSALKLVTAMSEEPDDAEPQRLMDAPDVAALVRFRVKARPFLKLVSEKQERFHELPPDLIKELNRCIIDEIEIVTRREAGASR